MLNKSCSNEAVISVILRLAMALLFGLAAYGKFAGGIDVVVTNFTTMFQNLLPAGLVTIYARVLPFLEALIAIWLLVGFRLRLAWTVTAFTLLSLAFGLMVAKQSPADIYAYLIIVSIGIFVSNHDCCTVGKKECCSHDKD